MLQLVILACAISAIHGAVIQSGCGKPAIKPNTMSAHIVGGVPVEPHSWPWQTQMLYSWDDADYSHMCGATIIDESTIISAAHCFPQGERYRGLTYIFSFGGHFTDHTGPYEISNRQNLKASRIYLHDDYEDCGSRGLFNDIALIKLDGRIEFNDHVSAVCLPTNRPNAGDIAYVTGWGYREKDLINTPVRLQQVAVPIVSPNDCTKSYRYGDDPSMICAGYEEGGKDSCQGDSGGPMVVYDEVSDIWNLVGVVSWGHGCADAGKLGAYSNVEYFLDWIEEKRKATLPDDPKDESYGSCKRPLFP